MAFLSFRMEHTGVWCFFLGWVFLLAGVSVDEYVRVGNVIGKIAHNETSNTFYVVKQPEAIETFGTFTAQIHGGSGLLQQVVEQVSFVDCTYGFFHNANRTKTTDICRNTCNTKKVFSGIAILAGLVAVLWASNTDNKSMVVSKTARGIAASFAVLFFVSLVILLALYGHGMEASNSTYEYTQTVASIPTRYEVYPTEFGVCDYKITKINATAGTLGLYEDDTKDVHYGSSMILGIVSASFGGLGAIGMVLAVPRGKWDSELGTTSELTSRLGDKW